MSWWAPSPREIAQSRDDGRQDAKHFLHVRRARSASPRLIRIVEDATRGGRPIASRTGLASEAPTAQALPVDTAMPARSRLTRSASPSQPSIATFTVVGRRSCAGPSTHGAGNRGEARAQAVRQRARAARRARTGRSPRPAERGGQRDGARDVLGAPPEPLLLGPAAQQGLELRAAADEERPDAGGGAELVPREGEQVDAEAVDPEVDEARRPWPRRTGRGRPGGAAPAATCGDREEGPGLVVGQHDGRHGRAGAARRRRSPRRPRSPSGRGGTRATRSPRSRARRPGRGRPACSMAVTTTRRPTPARARAAPTSPRLSASVPPLVKSDLAPPAPEHRGDALARRFEEVAGPTALRVGRGRVAQGLGEARARGAARAAGCEGRRGVVIEVRASHGRREGRGYARARSSGPSPPGPAEAGGERGGSACPSPRTGSVAFELAAIAGRPAAC